MFTCCCPEMAWTRCCLGVWQKDGGRCSGWWLSSSDITFLRKSQGLVKKHSYFMQAVHFTVDCPQLSWKKPENFSFDNMGPLRFEAAYTTIILLMIYHHRNSVKEQWPHIPDMKVTHICIPQKVERNMRWRSLAVTGGSLSVDIVTGTLSSFTSLTHCHYAV